MTHSSSSLKHEFSILWIILVPDTYAYVFDTLCVESLQQLEVWSSSSYKAWAIFTPWASFWAWVSNT